MSEAIEKSKWRFLTFVRNDHQGKLKIMLFRDGD